jgi:hypothetical protein
MEAVRQLGASLTKRGVMLLSLAVTALLVGAIWWYSHPQTLDDYAKRLVECIRARDAGCVNSFISKDEKKAYNLSDEQLSKFLSFINESAPEGAPDRSEFERASDGLWSSYSISWDRHDRTPFYLSATVAMGPDGPVAPDLISSLISGNSLNLAPGKERYTIYRATAEVLPGTKERLVTCGITGVYRAESDPQWTSLDELIRRNQARIADGTAPSQ